MERVFTSKSNSTVKKKYLFDRVDPLLNKAVNDLVMFNIFASCKLDDEKETYVAIELYAK